MLVCIGPVGRKVGTRLPPKECDGIPQIRVQGRVMGHQSGNGLIAHHHATQHAEPPQAVASALQKPQRRCCSHQSLDGLFGEMKFAGERRCGLRSGRENTEEVEAHTRKEHLRVDKPGDQVEKRTCLSAGNRTG
jgi:hypothetical protein